MRARLNARGVCMAGVLALTRMLHEAEDFNAKPAKIAKTAKLLFLG